MPADAFRKKTLSAKHEIYNSCEFGDDNKKYKLLCGINNYKGIRKLRVWDIKDMPVTASATSHSVPASPSTATPKPGSQKSARGARGC